MVKRERAGERNRRKGGGKGFRPLIKCSPSVRPERGPSVVRWVAFIHRESEKAHSRKASFVLCSTVRSVQLIGYTGLHRSSACSPNFREEFFSETQQA